MQGERERTTTDAADSSEQTSGPNVYINPIPIYTRPARPLSHHGPAMAFDASSFIRRRRLQQPRRALLLPESARTLPAPSFEPRAVSATVFVIRPRRSASTPDFGPLHIVLSGVIHSARDAF